MNPISLPDYAKLCINMQMKKTIAQARLAITIVRSMGSQASHVLVCPKALCHAPSGLQAEPGERR
jgi:hypothetical protein